MLFAVIWILQVSAEKSISYQCIWRSIYAGAACHAATPYLNGLHIHANVMWWKFSRICAESDSTEYPLYVWTERVRVIVLQIILGSCWWRKWGPHSLQSYDDSCMYMHKWRGRRAFVYRKRICRRIFAHIYFVHFLMCSDCIHNIP